MNKLQMIAATTGCGLALGSMLGYKVRCLVERRRGRRAERVTEGNRLFSQAKNLSFIQPTTPKFIPAAKRRQEVPVISESTSDRDDVVAALVGAGFKKGEANTAVDACSLVERASGVEAWTRAALSKAR